MTMFVEITCQNNSTIPHHKMLLRNYALMEYQRSTSYFLVGLGRLTQYCTVNNVNCIFKFMRLCLRKGNPNPKFFLALAISLCLIQDSLLEKRNPSPQHTLFSLSLIKLTYQNIIACIDSLTLQTIRIQDSTLYLAQPRQVSCFDTSEMKIEQLFNKNQSLENLYR